MGEGFHYNWVWRGYFRGIRILKKLVLKRWNRILVTIYFGDWKKEQPTKEKSRRELMRLNEIYPMMEDYLEEYTLDPLTRSMVKRIEEEASKKTLILWTVDY